MKPIRWTPHALGNLGEREILREEADRTLEKPDLVVPDQPGRKAFMRRDIDLTLRAGLLLRIVVEETADELGVITLYKTSPMDRSLGGARQ